MMEWLNSQLQQVGCLPSMQAIPGYSRPGSDISAAFITKHFKSIPPWMSTSFVYQGAKDLVPESKSSEDQDISTGNFVCFFANQ
jgi:hypothetical protein